MDEVKAAARLSAALGRKIDPGDIDFVHGSYVSLGPGQVLKLYAGNAAYAGNGQWFKNGRPWERVWDDRNVPRPLEDAE